MIDQSIKLKKGVNNMCNIIVNLLCGIIANGIVEIVKYIIKK